MHSTGFFDLVNNQIHIRVKVHLRQINFSSIPKLIKLIILPFAEIARRGVCHLLSCCLANLPFGDVLFGKSLCSPYETPIYVDRIQGDQIGQIFTNWVIVFLG
jgi:hypothetical protein